MQTNFVKLFMFVVVVVFVVALIENVDATYRKPPFNGSIFGKRSSTIDYDNAGKALSSMCEIASEACQAWFPAQDK
ncbi:neuropeptide SIFamide [Onthophagus taurus]|uniref:neuropeptide SIFamide n=1 Tax=Onthophagus taurus TaxID=166361 RepID=UPI0039BDB13B